MRNLNSLTAEIVEGGVVFWFDIVMIVHETEKACSQTSVLCIANTKDSSRRYTQGSKSAKFLKYAQGVFNEKHKNVLNHR